MSYLYSSVPRAVREPRARAASVRAGLHAAAAPFDDAVVDDARVPCVRERARVEARTRVGRRAGVRRPAVATCVAESCETDCIEAASSKSIGILRCSLIGGVRSPFNHRRKSPVNLLVAQASPRALG